MSDKRFVLGLGAQKAGTTWLHDYLASRDGADMGFIKEYHFLDVWLRQDDPKSLRKRGFKRKLVENARKLLLEENYSFEDHPDVWVRLAWHSYPELYFEYFSGLLRQSNIYLTGDLTPDHSILGAEELKILRATFDLRGIIVKPIFLMRDPVERIWSAVRMNRRKGKELPEFDDEKEILRRLKVRPVLERSSYDKTLGAMSDAFGLEKCFVGLYETLFTEAEVKRLCDFLGISYVQPDFEKRVNTTHKESSVSEETVKIAARQLRPSYEAASSLFGRERLIDLWPSAKHVL